MARGYFEDVVLDTKGEPVPGAQISVYVGDTQTLAQIYSDEAGAPKANPFYADALGRFGFWVDSGTYRVEATSGSSTGTKYLHVISALTQADADARYVNAAGDTMTGPLTLPADPTADMHAATKQYVDNLPRYHTVQSGGTALPQRRVLRAGTGLQATDDATNARTDLSVVADTTVQRVEVAQAGTLVATRKRLNFAAGPGASVSVADDATNNKADITIGLSGALRRRTAVLVVPGSPSAAVAPATARLVMPVAGTIVAVRSTCRVAVSSGTYTYDLNRNGTTMYTTQANRPTRTAADGIGVKTHTLPDVTSFSALDVLDVDVDAVGSGIQDFALFVEFDVS